MILSNQQIKAVTALSGQDRYKHFVKQVTDLEEVWGLYDDGWATAADDNGKYVLPVWPASDYAQLCATDGWETYKPKSIDLDEFIEDFLPGLMDDNVSVGVFYLPTDYGVVVEAGQLVRDLHDELSKY